MVNAQCAHSVPRNPDGYIQYILVGISLLDRTRLGRRQHLCIKNFYKYKTPGLVQIFRVGRSMLFGLAEQAGSTVVPIVG